MRQDGKSRVEIVDCILAIFLFVITRATKTGITAKDSFDFKVLNFMSTLRLSKEVSAVDKVDEDSNEDLETDDQLSDLIDNIQLEERKDSGYCQNCKIVTKENPNFTTLYKTLI